ncbi:MAG: hypothetical protein V3S75_01205 [Euzebya tangerina]|nr:hypothetical protein [Euzebya tangerina]
MNQEKLTTWFAGRIPDDWFIEPIHVNADRDEIIVTGTLAPPQLDDDTTDEARAVAHASRIDGFREDTRKQRIAIAKVAEHHFDRKVSWAARCGDTTTTFTQAAVPAMTRLRMPERAVLDTLIEAGVARSRSEALAWCVKLVGRNQAEWIDELRDALTAVERVRAEGPDAA